PTSSTFFLPANIFATNLYRASTMPRRLGSECHTALARRPSVDRPFSSRRATCPWYCASFVFSLMSVHPQQHASGFALPDHGDGLVHLLEWKFVRHQAVERQLAGLEQPHVARDVDVRLGAAAMRSRQHLPEMQRQRIDRDVVALAR